MELDLLAQEQPRRPWVHVSIQGKPRKCKIRYASKRTDKSSIADMAAGVIQ